MVALTARSPLRRARRTEAAIDAAIAADGGARFRELQRKWFPTIEDAYRGEDEDPFRSHLGASQIGRKCVREIWLGWRWTGVKEFPPRMLRLMNRGHLEEARFLALMEMIGVHLSIPEDGGQERISDHGGHYGSALDAVMYGLPDAPEQWALGELKTHNTKSFVKLVAEGVAVAKPEHYSQMQSCMARRGIPLCLYVAVNKNDDDLYCELVALDQPAAAAISAKAQDIITRRNAPPRISEDPSYMDCKWCDRAAVCHFPDRQPVLRNCRTCRHSVADLGGLWGCELHQHVLDKKAQLKGCDQHDPIPDLTKR